MNRAMGGSRVIDFTREPLGKIVAPWVKVGAVARCPKCDRNGAVEEIPMEDGTRTRYLHVGREVATGYVLMLEGLESCLV